MNRTLLSSLIAVALLSSVGQGAADGEASAGNVVKSAKKGHTFVVSGHLVDESGNAVANTALYEGACSQPKPDESTCQFIGLARVTGSGLGFEGAIGVDNLAVIERLNGKLFEPVAKTNGKGHFRIKTRVPKEESDKKYSYFLISDGGAFLGKDDQCLCLDVGKAAAAGTTDLGKVTIIRPQKK